MSRRFRRSAIPTPNANHLHRPDGAFTIRPEQPATLSLNVQSFQSTRSVGTLVYMATMPCLVLPPCSFFFVLRSQAPLTRSMKGTEIAVAMCKTNLGIVKNKWFLVGGTGLQSEVSLGNFSRIFLNF